MERELLFATAVSRPANIKAINMLLSSPKLKMFAVAEIKK